MCGRLLFAWDNLSDFDGCRSRSCARPFGYVRQNYLRRAGLICNHAEWVLSDKLDGFAVDPYFW